MRTALRRTRRNSILACVGLLGLLAQPVADAQTRISQIQGARHLSTLAGQSVAGVTGIVTGVRTNGFYLQDPAPDADLATSEGIFVFTNSAPTVAVGDSLSVAGTVLEFRPGGSSGNNLSITELTSPSIIRLSTGNALPAAVVLGTGGRAIPNVVIDDDATGDVETTGSFDAATDGIDFFESLEGMLVQVNNPVAIGPTVPQGVRGDLPVLADNGTAANLRTVRGGLVLRATDSNPERLQLFDRLVGTTLPQVDTGDSLSSLTAVVDYEAGNYRLFPTATPTVVDNALTAEVTSLSGSTQRLSVAKYNVANLDPSDGAPRFAAVAGQIVSNLGSPDIVVLTEMQDNSGATNNGVTAADITFQTLIDAITTAGGPTYQYREIAPVSNEDGGEPGGNIRIGFLFNPSRVAFVDRPGAGATVPAAVTTGANGVQLVYSPARIDPLNTAWSSSRKPLVGEFTFNARTVFVIGAHFNAKGGDDPLFGRNQPPVRVTEVQRNAQAAIVSSFVQQIRGLDPQASIVVLGDFNDYQFSNALAVLKAGSGLVNLTDLLPENDRYNYLFDGNSMAMDHILVSPAIDATGAVQVDMVHANVEFFTRVSEHDPIVATMGIGVIADSSPPVIAATRAGTIGDNGWFTSDVLVTWTVTDAQSPVTSTSGCDSTTITTDTQGTTLTCSASSAGGSNSESVTITRDATAPIATSTPSPVANSAGWHKTSVTVSFSGTDATSGIASCSASTSVTAQGTDQTSGTGTCTDNAGNVSAPTSVSGIDIDKTAPVVTATPAPAPNGSGWNTTAVTVTYTASDSLSGVAADGCDAPDTLASDGAGQSATGTCRDVAGNQGSDTANGIDIDRSAPNAVATATPPPNANGWNNTNVTVSFSATDGLSGSGVAGCSPDALVSSEGTAVISSGTCDDVAGNTSSAASTTTSIDKTAPTAAISVPVNGATYAQGATVAASYACSDTRSGVSQCAGTVNGGAAIDTATAGPKSFTVVATDNAGNTDTASATYSVMSPVDVTAPAIAAAVMGSAGSDGWYRSNVSVKWIVTDPESGVTSSSGCTEVTLKRDTATAGITYTCQATSAGGTSSSSVVIKRDTVLPSVSIVKPTNNAIYSIGQVVLAQYSCQDGLSGLTQCTGSVPAGTAIDTSSPGSKQFFVSGRDRAGNARTSKITYKVQ